jgi:hypothetical protein
MEPVKLPSLHAGSWINHNFRIWIGHREDNKAWDALYHARKVLRDFEINRHNIDPQKAVAALEQIHIAEGSDWCWWYGDEHIGSQNDDFDMLYRTHLASVYKCLGVEPPLELSMPIHRGNLESFISPPECLITPQLDGLLTHYYEWSGAGFYDCIRAGGAMHRVQLIVGSVHFAFDRESFYIRLDFNKDFDLVGVRNLRVVIDFLKFGSREIILEKAVEKELNDFAFSFNRLLEIRFGRKALTGTGTGKLEFFVLLYSGKELLEKWPFDEPISLDLPEWDKEVFWQL